MGSNAVAKRILGKFAQPDFEKIKEYWGRKLFVARPPALMGDPFFVGTVDYSNRRMMTGQTS